MFRQFFSLIGAITFVSLLKDILEIHNSVLDIITAVTNTTRPIWGYLLSWIGFPISFIFYDYLTMGTIVAGMILRSDIYIWKRVSEGVWTYVHTDTIPFIWIQDIYPGQWFRFYFINLPVRLFISLFLWPIRLSLALRTTLFGRWKLHPNKQEMDKEDALKARQAHDIFYETFMWAILLLVINYSLVFSGI